MSLKTLIVFIEKQLRRLVDVRMLNKKIFKRPIDHYNKRYKKIKNVKLNKSVETHAQKKYKKFRIIKA